MGVATHFPRLLHELLKSYTTLIIISLNMNFNSSNEDLLVSCSVVTYYLFFLHLVVHLEPQVPVTELGLSCYRIIVNECEGTRQEDGCLGPI